LEWIDINLHFLWTQIWSQLRRYRERLAYNRHVKNIDSRSLPTFLVWSRMPPREIPSSWWFVQQLGTSYLGCSSHSLPEIDWSTLRWQHQLSSRLRYRSWFTSFSRRLTHDSPRWRLSRSRRNCYDCSLGSIYGSRFDFDWNSSRWVLESGERAGVPSLPFSLTFADCSLQFSDPRSRNDPEECCKRPLHLKHPYCDEIRIPDDDYFYRLFNVKCIDFVRAFPSPRAGCKLGSRAQFNTLTSVIDGNTVYGVNEKFTRKLRTGFGGLLRM
jgi:hypothetical protein